LWQQGYRTFKWKIGVANVKAELPLFQQLSVQLPGGARLRLDANGGLDLALARLWLAHCNPEQVEFLEQPLPPSEFEAMQALCTHSPIPLALDESAATLVQLKDCYQRGWRHIFVVKPAIVGSPQHLRNFCQQNPLDLVFSSVLEGPIARQAGLRLAAELGTPGRAVGFGVTQWLGVEEESAKDGWEKLGKAVPKPSPPATPPIGLCT
jgi:O-succinylbenzoate synthase